MCVGNSVNDQRITLAHILKHNVSKGYAVKIILIKFSNACSLSLLIPVFAQAITVLLLIWITFYLFNGSANWSGSADFLYHIYEFFQWFDYNSYLLYKTIYYSIAHVQEKLKKSNS